MPSKSDSAYLSDGNVLTYQTHLFYIIILLVKGNTFGGMGLSFGKKYSYVVSAYVTEKLSDVCKLLRISNPILTVTLPIRTDIYMPSKHCYMAPTLARYPSLSV